MHFFVGGAESRKNKGEAQVPRGLAAVLDPDDEIAEVTPDDVAILKAKRDFAAVQAGERITTLPRTRQSYIAPTLR